MIGGHAPGGVPGRRGRILVVDDNRMNRMQLERVLKAHDQTVVLAEHGRRALELLRDQEFDLVLLDIMMPELDGHAVLAQMKADPALRDIPVIVVSAADDVDSVVRCIQAGAEDHLAKPYDAVLLGARIGACLEKKRLRDAEQEHVRRLQEETERSERLLLNILPKPIADRLKGGERVIADSFADVTVMFADIVDFTRLATRLTPGQVVDLLNEIFSCFDRLAEEHGLEKIKTVGDAYMACGGLPTPRADHASAVADMALAVRAAMPRFEDGEEPLAVRVGIDSGPVVAGVIGQKKFSYDLWGDTVNTAHRMASHGRPGDIQVTASTRQRLGDRYLVEERGVIPVKGKGEMITYLLKARR